MDIEILKFSKESHSIIESDPWKDFNLGGRAIEQAAKSEEPVAMTPPGECKPLPEGVDQQVEPRPFFGQETLPPQYELLKEQPHHRVLIYLAAAGDTPAEIAEKTGFTRPMVGYVLKQPWALQAIGKIQEKAGKKSVMNVLQGATLMAAERLIKIAEGQVPGAKISDSVNCAKEILSRVYGSAPQVVLTGKVDPNELTDEELASRLRGN